MKENTSDSGENRIHWFWGVALVALVSCGGGGSSGEGSTSEPPDSPPQTDDNTSDDSAGDNTASDDGADDDGPANDGDNSNDDDAGNDSSSDPDGDNGTVDNDSSDDSSNNDDPNNNDDNQEAGNDNSDNDAPNDDSDTVDSSQNQPPTVDAGDDQSLHGGDSTTLTAVASDPDGDVTSYQWTQIEGDNVSFEGDSTDTLSFIAPAVTSAPLELVFSVTVADDYGDNATDTVSVTVAPEQAPSLTLDFPAPRAIDEHSVDTLAAFGRVEVPEETELDQVMVDAGEGEQVADISGERWRVNQVALPDEDVITLTVTATNMAGDRSEVQSTLYRNRTELGEGKQWDGSAGMVLGPDGEQLYMLTYGGVPGLRLFSLDLANGDRGASLTDFFDTSLGPYHLAYFDMIYDPSEDHFLLAVSAEGEDKRIMAVDRATGQRFIYSGPERGQGPKMVNPVDLSLGPDGQLWVIDKTDPDEGTSTPSTGVMRIAPNGDRERVLQSPSLHAGAWDAANDRFFTVPETEHNPHVTVWDLSLDSPAGTTFSSGSPSLEQGAASIHLDHENDRLLMRARGTDALVAVNLSNGSREELGTNLLGTTSEPGVFNATETAYNPQTGVFYAAGGADRDAVVAIDPHTGSKVVISR